MYLGAIMNQERLDVEIIDMAEDEEWRKREVRLVLKESEFIANCDRHENATLVEWMKDRKNTIGEAVWI